MSLRIAGVSYVSVGYGSPQVPMLVQSLRQHFPESEAVVYETDQSERPPVAGAFPGLDVERISSPFHPFSQSGRVHFVREVARRLNKSRPEVLLLSVGYTLPVLFKLKYRPKAVIYYVLENPFAYQGFRGYDLQMHHHLEGAVDLLLYPEENRLIRDMHRLPIGRIPSRVVLNACNEPDSADAVVSIDERNGAIFYGGTIERGRTFAEYFLEDSIQEVRVDLYGLIEGEDKKKLRRDLCSGTGNIRYCGYVSAAELQRVRRSYGYSLVMWRTDDEAQLYAAPNKFFESIADGIPPIAAPHPQCAQIVRKYGCGILLDGWSYEQFRSGVDYAMRLFGTSHYADMVEACRRAVRTELNWGHQLAPVLRVVEQLVGVPSVSAPELSRVA